MHEKISRLQYHIHKHPHLYAEEVQKRYESCKYQFKIFLLNPNQYEQDLVDNIKFLTKVISHDKEQSKEFLSIIKDILTNKCVELDSEMRLIFCKALIALRHRKLLNCFDLTHIFFNLLIQCGSFDSEECDTSTLSKISPNQKRILRQLIGDFVISDVKASNLKRSGNSLNSQLQNYLNGILTANKGSDNIDYRSDEGYKSNAKLALHIMMTLYKKRIWNDAKTVNFLAQACFHKISNIMSIAIHFFLDPSSFNDYNDKQSSKAQGKNNEEDAKELIQHSKFVKKTKSRARRLKKTLKEMKKQTSKESDPMNTDLQSHLSTFGLINLLYDSQEFAEKLFQQVQHRNEGFEQRMATLDLISRIIGLHKLQILNFYPYMERYLQPHQSNVTKLLLYLVQATHDLVPPDALKPIIVRIANNFITEKNSGEVITVGLNSIREICARDPLVMEKDILNDLELYRSYKNKNVVMAARSLINVFRQHDPSMLLKKDRGKIEKDWKDIKPLPFGVQSQIKSFIQGADALVNQTQLNNLPEGPTFKTELLTQICTSHILTDAELRKIATFNKKRSRGELDTDEKSVKKNKKETPVLKDECVSDGHASDDENENSDSEDEDLEASEEDLSDQSQHSSETENSGDENISLNAATYEISTEKSENLSQNRETTVHSNQDDDSEVESNSASTIQTTSDSENEEDLLPNLGDIERIYKLPKMKKADRKRVLQERRAEIKAQENTENNTGKGGRKRTNRSKRKCKPFMMVVNKMRRQQKSLSHKAKLKIKKQTISKNRRFKKMNKVKGRKK